MALRIGIGDVCCIVFHGGGGCARGSSWEAEAGVNNFTASYNLVKINGSHSGNPPVVMYPMINSALAENVPQNHFQK